MTPPTSLPALVARASVARVGFGRVGGLVAGLDSRSFCRLPCEIVQDLRDKVRLRIRSLRDWRKNSRLFGTEKTRDIEAVHKSVLESRFLKAWADYRENAGGVSVVPTRYGTGGRA